jgi:hypothetical protein
MKLKCGGPRLLEGSECYESLGQGNNREDEPLVMFSRFKTLLDGEVGSSSAYQ